MHQMTTKIFSNQHIYRRGGVGWLFTDGIEITIVKRSQKTGYEPKIDEAKIR